MLSVKEIEFHMRLYTSNEIVPLYKDIQSQNKRISSYDATRRKKESSISQCLSKEKKKRKKSKSEKNLSFSKTFLSFCFLFALPFSGPLQPLLKLKNLILDKRNLFSLRIHGSPLSGLI